MYQGSPLFPIFRALSRSLHRHSCCRSPPSHHPSSLTTVFLVLALNTLLTILYLSILSTCPNYLNTLRTTLLANYLSFPALLRTSSIPILSNRDTPTKLLKHFISRTFTFLLPALLIPHASAPYKAVGTITPSYKHFLAFIPNDLLLRTLFSALHAQYPSLILYS